MARPVRRRRICFEPKYDSFAPCGAKSRERVLLTVDEFEAVRLIDHEKKTHEQCARQMGVSCTTVTEMYDRARAAAEMESERKEDGIMKIVVTYENGNVFPHFGHTEQFKVYEIEDRKVAGTQVVDTNGSGHKTFHEIIFCST